jgi:hypothetical protein
MPDVKVMTMDEVVKSDPKDWGTDEVNIIAEEAKKERDIEQGKRTPDEPAKKDDTKPATENKEAAGRDDESADEEAAKAKVEEDKKAKEVEDKKKEDERLLAADDKDLKDEEKAKKSELVKAKAEADAKADEAETKAFAEAKKLPVEEAKKEREHIKAIRAKYKDSPDDMAYAFLSAQRAMTKAQEEAKAIREYAPVRSIEKMTSEDIITEYLDGGKLKANGKPITREQAIEQYRAAKPKQTENAEDEAVLLMIADNIRNHMVLKQKESLVNSKVAAKEKREQVMSSIPEHNKKYADEIRDIINAMSDQNILSEGFNAEDVALWVKGSKVEEIEKNFETEKKKSFDEGCKKGKEEAKILGVKTGGQKPSGQPSKKTATLSEAQKKEALDMFEVDTMSEEEKFEAYKEVKGIK